jgi:hypothetical protein
VPETRYKVGMKPRVLAQRERGGDKGKARRGVAVPALPTALFAGVHGRETLRLSPNALNRDDCNSQAETQVELSGQRGKHEVS